MPMGYYAHQAYRFVPQAKPHIYQTARNAPYLLCTFAATKKSNQ
jgi:hypothetical protein